MIIECDAVKKDAPLRQGDIFVFLNKNDLWENLGVIITTDCDITYCKNSNVYSYCPIINIRDYFFRIYLPNLINLDQILIIIKNIIDKQKNENNNGVDINIISSWIKERGIENALNDINNKSDNIKKAISFLFNYNEEKCSIPIYLEYKSIINPRFDTNKEKDKLVNDFKNHIVKLPKDLFYINYIHNFDDFGYIVYLRRIGMFNRENIIISNDDDREYAYLKRIARMVPPFNYRITQKIAQMFSDIGLPEDYEEDRKSIIEILFKE